MSTISPTSRVALSGASGHLAKELEQAISGGLGNLSLRELLGLTLSSLGEAERSAYLQRSVGDKGNGGYERSVIVGSVPLDVRVPRTRSGEFRPRLLPAPYQRAYPEEMQQLLVGLLVSSRSINAAKAALRGMGVSVPEAELEAIASDFVEELELRNTSPVDTDLLAVFVDGKAIEIREDDRIRPACIYVVVGLGRDGKKRVLACLPRAGKETLEEWKKVLRGLVERGLRRVLIVVHDDLVGLHAVVNGLFSKADDQLCIVHMQRNAKNHLNKAEAAEFVQRIRAIKASWSLEVATRQFDDLCDHFEEASPAFVALLRKKRDSYLCFLKYPEAIRRTLSTTNAVEAVNGQLENMRRNSGGYFQSENALKLKLGAAITFLEQGTWARPAASVRSCLHQLNAMFESRFETEEG